MRIFDQHAPGDADAPDAPGRVPEQHDVAGQAFDREVLVDGADDGAFRLGDDGVEAGVRNRAAAGDRDQARAAPARGHGR